VTFPVGAGTARLPYRYGAFMLKLSDSIIRNVFAAVTR